MARRPFPDEPVSRVAVWSSRLGLFAIAVAALSVIIVRSGLLEIVPALATFGASLVFAGLAILLAFAAFVVIWRQGTGGLGRALLGLFLGLALLAYPAYLGTRALRLPAIADAPRFVSYYILHRKAREDSILHRLSKGVTDIPTIVRAIYIGIDPRLTGAAGLSVLAHLEDLVARGVVETDGQPAIDGVYRLAG